MISWESFRHQNTAYDLTHLHPRIVIFTQAAKGDRPERTYTVNVAFGLHCFTRGLKENEQPDPALSYSDSREARIFDFERFELSKRLPALVQNLPQSKCFHTGHANYFSIEVLNDQGHAIEYEIYFAVTRSGKKGGRLTLFVQSAYVRDDKHGLNKPQKKAISFYVILFNTLNDRPIKPAP
ncbi:MAG TPA: hypothetical protein VFC15_15110 [Candidatus Limnocylindrales bacterium]|jgi:hypothetical protein|nr:hypothetical protein [Candidatus Limnocylindrales bacterium]